MGNHDVCVSSHISTSGVWGETSTSENWGFQIFDEPAFTRSMNQLLVPPLENTIVFQVTIKQKKSLSILVFSLTDRPFLRP